MERLLPTQRVPAVGAIRIRGKGGLQDAGQLLSNHPVDIGERDVFVVEQLGADLVQRVILMHQNCV